MCDKHEQQFADGLYIDLKVYAGTNIAKACESAVALSKRLGIHVWFDFNGVRCLVTEDTAPEALAEEWGSALASSATHKVAAARGTAAPHQCFGKCSHPATEAAVAAGRAE